MATTRSKNYVYWALSIDYLHPAPDFLLLDNVAKYIDRLGIIVILTPPVFIFFSFLRNAIKPEKELLPKFFQELYLEPQQALLLIMLLLNRQ